MMRWRRGRKRMTADEARELLASAAAEDEARGEPFTNRHGPLMTHEAARKLDETIMAEIEARQRSWTRRRAR